MFEEESSSFQTTYALDSESTEELKRLLIQERILNKETGPLLPEGSQADIATMSTVLDLACGPGGWTLDLAAAHPHLQVTGMDISHLLLQFASDQARRRTLENVTFHTMDMKQPFPIADQTFDLINIRLIVLVIYRDVWPQVLKECLRVLRPGGILRVTETDTVGLSNLEAYEAFFALVYQASQKIGYGFSPDGKTFGMTHELEPLLHWAGYEQIESRPHIVSYSAGSTYHADMVYDFIVLAKNVIPLLVRTGVASQEEAEQSYQKMVESTQAKDFHALWYLLTTWGTRPAGLL